MNVPFSRQDVHRMSIERPYVIRVLIGRLAHSRAETFNSSFWLEDYNEHKHNNNDVVS